LPGSDNAAINIIGFSAGGAIAARFAALEKKNIRSLMLMATPADLSQIILEDKELMASHFRELGLIRDRCLLMISINGIMVLPHSKQRILSDGFLRMCLFASYMATVIRWCLFLTRTESIKLHHIPPRRLYLKEHPIS
jgi:pimeloyl-ACP methyl ester carboxylesterase